jgi:polyhydroxybutyrate depolymerase
MLSMWRLAWLVVGAVACSSPTSQSTASASAVAVASSPSKPSASANAPLPEPLGGLQVPASRAGQKLPLVLWLHGYGASGGLFIGQLGVSELADELGFAYLAPDGMPDRFGRRFWNAGAACCDFDHKRPDHVRELKAMLDVALTDAAVDPARVYVVGYSNGAFMAHRLACDDERVRAIAAIAGAGPRSDEPCPRKAPLGVLAVHGDEDEVVEYGGGHVLGKRDIPAHPSVVDTLRVWATKNGCTGKLEKVGERDLQPKILGAETSEMRMGDCRPPLEVWLVHGGGHLVATRKAALAMLFTALDESVGP